MVLNLNLNLRGGDWDWLTAWQCALGDSEADHLESKLSEWQATEPPSSKDTSLERHPNLRAWMILLIRGICKIRVRKRIRGICVIRGH